MVTIEVSPRVYKCSFELFKKIEDVIADIGFGGKISIVAGFNACRYLNNIKEIQSTTHHILVGGREIPVIHNSHFDGVDCYLSTNIESMPRSSYTMVFFNGDYPVTIVKL